MTTTTGWRVALFLFLSLCLPSAEAETPGGSGADSCAGLVPPEAAAALEVAYPAFRLPSAADNLPEDRKYNEEQGGNGCLGIAIGDLVGGLKRDLGILLTAKDNKSPTLLVVVRPSRSKKWQIDKLYEFKSPRHRLFVELLQPGRYERAESLEGSLEPGEVKRVEATTFGLLAGKLESEAVAFFFRNGRWVHVWIAD